MGQFDAPTDPTAFVHRIGRTARAGQSGRSVLMVLPHEDSYIPFLQKRGIHLDVMPSLAVCGGSPVVDESESNAVAIRRTRRLVETDRAVMLKANKAFVSYLRAYQEHQLPYIFPFKSLDLGALATCFCVLRLPRVKEILGRKIKGFEQSAVHPSAVPFTNKKQEKLRQEKLEKKRAEDEAAEKETEIQRKKNEQQAAKAAKEAARERTRTQKRKAARSGRAEEWRLLGREESLAKKLKAGKITAAQFKHRLQKATKPAAGKKLDADSESGSDESDDGDDGTWVKKRKKRRGKTKR